MNYNLFENMNQQQQNMLATLQKLNKLAVSNVEKMTVLQMNTLRNYSDLTVQQMQAIAEVKSPQQLQDYLNQQTESVKAMAEKIVADAKAAAELGVEFNTEAQKIAQDTLANVANKAA